MFGVKKYYGLRGQPLNLAVSMIAGLDFLYVASHVAGIAVVSNRSLSACLDMTKV